MATMFDKVMREVERFRRELPLRGEAARVWDGFETVLRQHPHEDEEGIETGWTVGVLVVTATENGGGDDLFENATKLVDRALKQNRWGVLDHLAFRILGAEMLLRSCLATEPVDNVRSRQIADLLTSLHTQLNGSGVHMPPDWRNLRQIKA